MVAFKTDDPAGNFIQLVEEIVARSTDDFIVVTAWEDDDDVPRIAYRTQETTSEDVWTEVAQIITIFINVFLQDEEIEYDLAPELAVGVTLPHMDSDIEGATGWVVRRDWVHQYATGEITEKDLLRLINESRHHVVERELLEAVDGEESLEWE